MTMAPCIGGMGQSIAKACTRRARQRHACESWPAGTGTQAPGWLAVEKRREHVAQAFERATGDGGVFVRAVPTHCEGKPGEVGQIGRAPRVARACDVRPNRVPTCQWQARARRKTIRHVRTSASNRVPLLRQPIVHKPMSVHPHALTPDVDAVVLSHRGEFGALPACQIDVRRAATRLT